MPFKRARGERFSPKKHVFLGLTPVYSETTALSKPYFILKLQSVRKFLRKRLLFKKQKVDFTGYYGIDDPFPDKVWKWVVYAIVTGDVCLFIYLFVYMFGGTYVIKREVLNLISKLRV